MKVEIAKNAVLDPDMTQEELDDMLEMMQGLADAGTLDAMSEPVDMEKLEQEDPELFKMLNEALEEVIEH